MTTKKRLQLIMLLLFFGVSIKAQLTPQQAIKGMIRGINIGNTLESPYEGDWGNRINKRAFADYKKAGFTAIRVPITWDKHTGTTSPFTIKSDWMARIDSVVTWGLAQKLFVIINAHHDGWIKDTATGKGYTEANKARFDSIWSQVATRFKNRNDSLIFEIINEPQPILQANIDDLNKRSLATIRKTNPTRIVIFSGNGWSNSDDLVKAAIPDVMDKYLMGYYHSYDPYPFGLKGPGSYGSDADINNTKAKFEQVAKWSAEKGIPVILGEYGYMKNCEYNSRMCAYATVVDLAIAYNISPFAWDDNGDFPIYNRTTGGFNEIKDILIHTYKESPNRMTISNYADTLIKLKWVNRTTQNDSIIVERSIGAANNLAFYTKISPTATEFIDRSVNTGKIYYYRIKADLKDSIELQSQPVMINNLKPLKKAYLIKGNKIPGTIEAENFDKGLEGISYHDIDFENLAGKYRFGEGVDIDQLNTLVYLTNNEPGEWQEYTDTIAESATYSLTAYVAATTVGGEFTIQFDGGAATTFAITSASANMTTFEKIVQEVQLTAGEHIMRVTITKKPEFNINKYVFVKSTAVESIENDGFSIFPNPATELIRLNGINEASNITIFNACGSIVLKTTLNQSNNDINITGLTNGVYMLKCNNSSKSICLKFIKK